MSDAYKSGLVGALRTIHQAITDPNTRLGNEVTGLPHRGQLLLALDEMIREGDRSPLVMAVVSIQVRRIHALTIALGFGAADALAQCMADRLREFSTAQEWGAHLGGAEFAWIAAAPVRSTEDQAMAYLSDRIRAMCADLARVAELQELSVLPDCRFGVSWFPGAGTAANQLLLAAQAAQMEGGHIQGLTRFAHQSQQARWRELRIESSLPLAVRNNELALVYMPLIDLRTDAVLGVEALLRWESPVLGQVSPAELIPVAERSGLIADVGRWVMGRALDDLLAIKGATGRQLRLFVNISVVQLQISDLKQDIERALKDRGLPPDVLTLELKEDIPSGAEGMVVERLQAISALGVGVLLDDFGKGRSGLNRLTQLPLEGVKVDHTVIEDINVTQRHASITRAAIHLAHELQLMAYADGVQTVEQMRHLLAQGCDVIQGYGIAAPMDRHSLATWIPSFSQATPPWRDPVQARGTLLIVDDEANILSSLRRLFRREGYQVLTASDGPSGLALLKTQSVDVIISDQRMPEMLGVDFLRQARSLQPETIRMTLSGFADLQSIIDAVNEGAIYRFLMKPWDDERLIAHVREAMSVCHLRKENQELQHEIGLSNRELAQSNRRLALNVKLQTQRAEALREGISGTHHLLDQLPFSIVGVDADRSLVYLNQQALQRFPEWVHDIGQPARQELCDALASLIESTESGHDGLVVELGGHMLRTHLCVQALPNRGWYLVFAPVLGEQGVSS